MTITQLVERERSGLRRLHVGAGVATGLAVTLIVVAMAVVVLGGARWLELPRGLPFVVWAVVAAVDVAAILLTRALIRRQTGAAHVAEQLEHEHSLRAGSVRGIMEVADHGSLGRRAAADLGARLGDGHDTLLPSTRGLARRRIVRVGAVAAVAAVSLAALAPSYRDGLQAVTRPVDAWRGTLLPPIRFADLPTAVVRGEPLRLRVSAPGRRAITLDQRATGEAWRSEPLSVDAAGVASFDVGAMSADLRLVATDGRTSTDTVIVRVTDRPFLGGVAIRAVYPTYLKRAAEDLAIGEPARVPAGTVVEVAGRASTTLASVTLSTGHDSSALVATGRTFRGRFQPKVSGSWSWHANGSAGVVSDVPPPIALEVVPDSAPHAEIVSPARDTLISPRDRIPLQLAATDDHGIRAVDITSWKTRGTQDATDRETNRVATTAGSVWGTTVVLDVAERGMEPGEVLHVTLVATDNSPAAQRGTSRELLVRVATVEEQRGLARDKGDSTVAAAQAAIAAQKALEQRANEAAQDRGARANNDGNPGSSNSMNFDAAQKAKALAQDQKSLTDQVNQLSQSAKALEDQLRQAGALDSGLAKQLQEAQAMLQDALTPELMKQLNKLQGAAQQLSKEDAQQSLKDLLAQQQRLREQLEKSAEMLRRAAMEGSMQTLSDEAKDIAQQQRKLADSTKAGEKSDKAGDKAADQKQQGANAQPPNPMADRTQRLTKDMQKLEQRLDNDKAATGAQKTAEAREHAVTAEEKMRDSKSGTEQGAHDAATQMDQASQSMKAARDGQVQEWKHELTSALDQSIQEMLQMSREESSLQQQMRGGQANPGDARGQQSAIKQGLDEAAERLQREAQKSSLLSGRSQRAVGEAQQKVDQATQSASDPKNGSQSANAMNDAAEALNKAAASLARDRERANTASSATGFAEMIQQMQEMAGKQNSINSQAQGIMPNPGTPMNSSAMAQARALARQQRQVADKLDELGDGAGGDKAAKLAQEARQLADALDGSRIDAGTLARQQQLFKKLLDAGRSLEKDEREESDHREAKAGSDSLRFHPEAASANGKSATRFREPTWDELRGLTPDERRIILEYFKKLNGKGG